MVSAKWLTLPGRFPAIILDEFVVMPNHFHGIII
jgi:putative transposase